MAFRLVAVRDDQAWTRWQVEAWLLRFDAQTTAHGLGAGEVKTWLLRFAAQTTAPWRRNHGTLAAQPRHLGNRACPKTLLDIKLVSPNSLTIPQKSSSLANASVTTQ